MLTNRCMSLVSIAAFAAVFIAPGCSQDHGTTAPPISSPSVRAISHAPEPDPPAGLVSIEASGQSIEVWPFTGSDFGTPSDPLNLVLVGKASVAQIRSALLSLDGNRSAFGFPPVAPFNQTWSDGMGGVQTAYAEGDGWLGSVVQLQLGNYGPVRVHLRLFETRIPFGEDGNWTIAGAHFELLIPGTADHQVLSWELAEQVVTADLVRSGLLGAAPSPTAIINPLPGYRTIPPAVYNGIPDGLKLVCGLPTGPSAVPVPIPTNGRATLLVLAGEAAEVGGPADQAFTLEYHLIIPRPFCSGGPLDFLFVEGPVSLRKSVRVGSDGRYEYDAAIRGHLVATPMDVTQSPPVPAGEPFNVLASDIQFGFLDARDARVSMQSDRVTLESGPQKQFIHLVVHEAGVDQYREATRCLTE